MDISKIKVENTSYDLKDAVLRNKVGSANGIATLDANGKVPASQLNIVEGYLDSGVFYKVENTVADYVEIGGLKWATKNIGASNVTDTGLYFQWGDTQGYTAAQVGSGSGQKYFGWSDYKFNPSGDGETMTKYNGTDGKTVLGLEDDGVRVNWGGAWRMPTTDEFQALGTATTLAWTADYEGSGVKGFVLTSKADSSKVLFFPAAGDCDNGSVYDVGSFGYYWSSSLSSWNVQYAYYLGLDSSYVDWQNDNSRCDGFAIRGVWGGQGTPVISLTVQVTPESNTLYIDTTTNKIYRYNGSAYVEISTIPIMGASGSNHSSGLVPDPGATSGTSKFLCEDGTWKEPSGGSGGGNISVMSGSGSEHAPGLVPDPGATAGTSKYLREDGTWVEPYSSLTESNGGTSKSLVTTGEKYIWNNKEDSLTITTKSSGTTLSASINTYYKFTYNVGTLAITLPTMDTSVTKPIGLMLSFTTGSSPAVTISSASSLTIEYFTDYSIEASKSYELNCLWNGTKWIIAYGTIG